MRETGGAEGQSCTDAEGRVERGRGCHCISLLIEFPRDVKEGDREEGSKERAAGICNGLEGKVGGQGGAR